jgi:hypothetical protein
MFDFIFGNFVSQYGVLIDIVIRGILITALAYFIYLIVQGIISWRNSDSSADLKKAVGNIKRSLIGTILVVIVYLAYLTALSSFLTN